MDVALDDPKPQQQPKKRGVFSRLMDSDSHSERPSSQDGTGSKGSWHHFGGRKRGQSGSGAELGSIPKQEETPRPESSQSKQDSNQPKQEERSTAPAKPESSKPKQEERSAAPAVQAEAQTKPGAENAQAPEMRVVDAS